MTRELGHLLMGLFIAAASLVSPLVHGHMKPLNNKELSNVTGQAFVQIDQYNNPADSSIDYQRITLGADISAQINAQKVELGRYPRMDATTGKPETQPADILINQLSLGSIYEDSYYTTNPFIPKPTKPDGSAYQNGDIVPFRITDPFLEIAYQNQTPVGIRIGFGGAQGSLSGTIQSLTGNVQATVESNLGYLTTQNGGVCPLTLGLCSLLTVPLSSVDLSSPATLVYPQGTTDANGNSVVGEPDPVRATTIGIKNGDMQTATVAGVTVGVTAQNCMVAATNVCFPLSQYKSLWIGKTDQQGNVVGPAGGLFLSFETQALQWVKDFPNRSSTSAYMNTTSGAFLNLPTGSMRIDTAHAMLGTQRLRTEYIDRGQGLF